jgi:hypothetical protein
MEPIESILQHIPELILQHIPELKNTYSPNQILFVLNMDNENNKSITFVRNLSCLYCTQTTLHVSAIQPSPGVSHI